MKLYLTEAGLIAGFLGIVTSPMTFNFFGEDAILIQVCSSIIVLIVSFFSAIKLTSIKDDKS